MKQEKEKFKIKSKNIETEEGETKRYFMCPFPQCEKGFWSYKTADACLNKQLNILCRCLTCEFVTHNLDSSRNHKCFAYSSAHERHASAGKCKSREIEKKKVKLDEEVNMIDED